MRMIDRSAESSREFLRTRTAFSKLKPALFEVVAKEFEWISFDREEILFSQGDKSDRIFFVVHGRLVISRRDNNGKEKVVGWVKPGESVGELALFEGDLRTATVRASRATVTISLSREGYEALAARVPQSLIVLNHLLATPFAK